MKNAQYNEMAVLVQDHQGLCRRGTVLRLNGRLVDNYDRPYERIATTAIMGWGELDGPAGEWEIPGCGYSILVPERTEV